MAIKSGRDIETVRELKNVAAKQSAPLDLALLCRQLSMAQEEYAGIFNCSVTFALLNFNEKEIEPYAAGGAVDSPEQFTGPFFTGMCDVKYTAILIQKLLDICVLLASRESERTVKVTIERMAARDLLIKVSCRSSNLREDDLPKLFDPYYGELIEKTNLYQGSGLEGFIAKEVSNQFHLPVQVNLTKDSAKIVFMLIVPKGEQSLSALASEQKMQKLEEPLSVIGSQSSVIRT